MRHLFATAIFLCVSCTGPNLAPLSTVEIQPAPVEQKFASAQIKFQSSPQVEVFGAMVFLPIVDHSGSNSVEPGATDPLAVRRYDPLVTLCEELAAQANPLIFSGLVTFGTNAFTRQTLTNNLNTACSTLRAQRTLRENLGWTNYLGALQTASAQLSAFLASHQNDTQRYKIAVAYITDGDPVVLGNDGQTVVTQDSNQIKAQVRAMKNMVLGYSAIVDEFRFHTAYYDRDGNRVQSAATLLAAMAAEGNGTYTEFISGEQLSVNAFLPPELLRDYHVNQVWATGNGAWEMVNGKATFELDSDMDGMSDRRETEAKCNASSRDSNGNGIGDLVEYRVYGACDSQPFLNCVYPTTQDTDADGLTDCEETVLAERQLLPLSRTNPISSASNLPDELAFRNNLFSAALGDPDLDGKDSTSELSRWLPPFLPNNDLIFAGLEHKIEELRALAEGVKEYQWTIQKIPVLRTGGDDVIRIIVPQYLDGSSLPVLKTAEKRISNLQVTFEPGDFR